MKKCCFLLTMVLLVVLSFVSCEDKESNEPNPVDSLLGEEYVLENISLSDEEIYEILQTGVWKWDMCCLYDAESKKLLSRESHSSYYKFNHNNVVMASSKKDTFEENPNNIYVVEGKRLIIKSKNYDGTEIDYYSIVRLDNNSIILDYDTVAFMNVKGDTLYKLSRKQESIFRMRYISCK